MVFPCVDLPHLDYPCVDIPHVEGRKTPDSRSERRFPMREYRNMASSSKTAYSERKGRKSTFILTVNRPYLSIIQGKENRLSHRPISSAKGTGGLDFLIVYAPLILCHSLFEVVIHNIAEWCEIVLSPFAVHPIVDAMKWTLCMGKTVSVSCPTSR